MDEPASRMFTIEQANQTLPLVRRIVADIRDEHAALQEKIGRLAAARRRGPSVELSALREQVAESSALLEKYLAELQQIGCLFKGVPEGLVDFASIQDGQAVFLCWRFGEQSVCHWHEMDAGFSGRRPLAAIPVTTLSPDCDRSE